MITEIPGRRGLADGRAHGGRHRDRGTDRLLPAGGSGAADGSAPDSYRPLTRLEILQAVPAGSRRARGQHEFLAQLGTDPELAELRTDRARNVSECLRVWARFASWADRTTRPTRRVMRRLTGLSVSTIKMARRWGQEHGYLGLVREGRAAWLRPGSLVGPDTPNEAQILVLCVPKRKPIQSPPVLADLVIRPLTPSRRVGVRPPARDDDSVPSDTPLGIVLRMRQQVAELSRGPGRELSERYVLSISRPWLAAGWSPADLAFAINHDPGRGRHRKRIAMVRDPSHWLAWRLSRWSKHPAWDYGRYRQLGHWDFTNWPAPIASPSAERAAQADRIRLEQEARRAAFDAAGRIDPAPHAAAIRARLGWRKGKIS